VGGNGTPPFNNNNNTTTLQEPLVILLRHRVPPINSTPCEGGIHPVTQVDMLVCSPAGATHVLSTMPTWSRCEHASCVILYGSKVNLSGMGCEGCLSMGGHLCQVWTVQAGEALEAANVEETVCSQIQEEGHVE